MSKNIVLCMDGTWNRPNGDDSAPPGKETNVCTVYEMSLNDGQRQVTYYNQGVGTHFGEILRGCIGGKGLSEDIRQTYQVLAEQYEPGDRVFLFGFSRGAYTARSLAGLIYACGLPTRTDASERVADEAYDLYRSNARKVQAALKKNQQTCPIEMLGVWDTVGALGIPIILFESLSDRLFQFHDLKLNGEVKAAYHAVAIDEQRRAFDCALWEEITPKPGQIIEQVWFSGVHADVGGGYPERCHSDIALQWMLDRAQRHGLLLDPARPYECHGVCQEDIHDSYRFIPYGPRTRRVAAVSDEYVPMVHCSVRDRMRAVPDYRPLALVDLENRANLVPYRVVD